MTLIRAAHREKETKRSPIAINKNNILIWDKYRIVSSLNVVARIKTRIAIENARDR